MHAVTRFTERRERKTLLSFSLAALLLFIGPSPARPQNTETPGATEQRLFERLGQMVTSVREISGLRPLKPIRRASISRKAIRELVKSRLTEEMSAEQIRHEELFLRKFGFVEENFNLAEQLVGVVAEQAAALYDFKTKTLYLATWAPDDIQEPALVHELVHVLEDQHFNLGKFSKKSKGADQDLARSAVVEGQASWVMIEHVLRQSGQSMIENSLLAAAAAGASRFEAERYPVYSASPLYLREVLLFPYTEGLLFHQAVIEKYGREGFARVFRRPPISSQQILLPAAYFEERKPTRPALPTIKLPRRFKKTSQGEVGQFDHFILLKQYVGEEQAESLAPRWRGGVYRIRETKSRDQGVLFYAVDWERLSDAVLYFDLYQRICREKWDQMHIEKRFKDKVLGRSETGGFVISRRGTVVTSIEGLPNDTLGAYVSKSL